MAGDSTDPSSSSSVLDASVQAFLSCLSDAARRRLRSSVRSEAEKIRAKKSTKYWEQLKRAMSAHQLAAPRSAAELRLQRQSSLGASQPPALIRVLSDRSANDSSLPTADTTQSKFNLKKALSGIEIDNTDTSAVHSVNSSLPDPYLTVTPDYLTHFTLNNGLKVYIYPRAIPAPAPASAPVATTSISLLVQCGSIDESFDESGFAHLLSHCAYRNTKKYPHGHVLNQFWTQQGQSLDIHSHCTVDYDLTRYTLSFNTDSQTLNINTEFILQYFKELMCGYIVLTPEVMKMEKEKMEQEIQQENNGDRNGNESAAAIDRSPFAAIKAAYSTSNSASPSVASSTSSQSQSQSQSPSSPSSSSSSSSSSPSDPFLKGSIFDRRVLGSFESIHYATPDRLFSFYQRHYQLNRMAIVIDGAIPSSSSLKHLEAQIRQCYESISSNAFSINIPRTITYPLTPDMESLHPSNNIANKDFPILDVYRTDIPTLKMGIRIKSLFECIDPRIQMNHCIENESWNWVQYALQQWLHKCQSPVLNSLQSTKRICTRTHPMIRGVGYLQLGVEMTPKPINTTIPYQQQYDYSSQSRYGLDSPEYPEFLLHFRQLLIDLRSFLSIPIDSPLFHHMTQCIRCVRLNETEMC